MNQLFEGSITKVHGIRVGQAQNDAAKTGVTVVLCSHDGLYAGLGVGWPRLHDIRRSIRHALVRRAGGHARQPADPPQKTEAGKSQGCFSTRSENNAYKR